MGDYRNENDMIKMKDEYFNIEVPKEFDYYIEDAINRAKAARKNRLKIRGMVAAACVLIFICINYVNWAAVLKGGEGSKTKVVSSKEKHEKLPVLGSFDNLKNLLAVKNNDYLCGGATSKVGSEPSKSFDSNTAGADMLSTKNAQYAGVKDYSKTNVQVQGVDEGDVVKTDGKYIYKMNYNKVVIASGYPAEEMKVESEILFENKLYAKEIFLKDKYMVVIGGKVLNQDKPVGGFIGPRERYFIPSGNTEAIIFDVSDKKKAKQVREIELEGSYISSRIIGSKLYLATNKFIPMYRQLNGCDDKDLLPHYKDSVGIGGLNEVSYDKIQYCPEAVEPNYIMVASLDLNKLERVMEITTVLGSANNMYVSNNNLYIAGRNYSGRREETSIYKFTLKDGIMEFAAKGNVPGYVLNQFSMDENNKYFRITTTSRGGSEQDNNLYVLDENLKIEGKLEGMAQGERIYSTRFIGDRAYMVTFKNTDPLFVIDIKNPKSPKVLGELKIPGFSNYLHPYDENHIIGFGKDTEEVSSVDQNGNKFGAFAKTKGMKLAIFDVTDVNSPKQEFVTTIGGRGTDSELLNNHKALLFDKDKNLLAFPVTVMKEGGGGRLYPYEDFEFQGVYVYNINLKEGFTLKGKISHQEFVDTKEKTSNKENQIIFGDYRVQRSLYINDILYTLSNGGIKANNLTDLKEISKLKIN